MCFLNCLARVFWPKFLSTSSDNKKLELVIQIWIFAFRRLGEFSSLVHCDWLLGYLSFPVTNVWFRRGIDLLNACQITMTTSLSTTWPIGFRMRALLLHKVCMEDRFYDLPTEDARYPDIRTALWAVVHAIKGRRWEWTPLPWLCPFLVLCSGVMDALEKEKHLIWISIL